jgi:hypothetical protein
VLSVLTVTTPHCPITASVCPSFNFKPVVVAEIMREQVSFSAGLVLELDGTIHGTPTESLRHTCR